MIADSAGTVIVGFSQSTVAYANWKAKSYILKFDAGEGTLPAGSEQMALFYDGDLLNLPIPTREGYDFVGWANASGATCSNGGVTLAEARQFTQSAYAIGEGEEVTLTAVWKETECKVTFDFNNGSYRSESVTVTYGTAYSELTLPAQDTGASMILSWSSFPNSAVSPEGVIRKDVTLYAIWGQYKVFTFHTYGGQTLEERIFRDMPSALPKPTRPGFELEGWYTNAALSGNPVASVTYGSGVTVYYPKWVEATYTVRFSTDGTEPITYRMGENLQLPTVEVLGYDFLGWCAREDLSDTPRMAITAGDWGDMTLYPKLQAKTYTVALDPNGGTLLGEASVVVTYGEGFSAVLPKRTGYTFMGWYTDKGEDAIRLTDASGNSINPFLQASATSFYAHWTPTIYSILYESNGGSSVAQQSAAYYSTVYLPEAPSKAGFLFNGWYNEDFTVEYGESFRVTGNTVIYAMWIESRAITSAEELKAMAKDPTANYHLACDINMNGETWTPINEFSGTFTGMGFRIYNFMLSDYKSSSRFGFVNINFGKIKGVVFDSVTYSYSYDGTGYGGLIAGVNHGKIIDCVTQNGKINYQGNNYTTEENGLRIGGIAGANAANGLIRNCSTSIDIEGNTAAHTSENWYYHKIKAYVGGITGENQDAAVIESCWVRNNITAKGSSHASSDYYKQYGRLFHRMQIGGIAGRSVSGTSIIGCFFEGEVGSYNNGFYNNSSNKHRNAVESNVGGIVGYAENATIRECSASGSVYAVSMSDTDQMTNVVGRAGGLVGMLYSNSLMENCVASVNVSTNGGYHDRGGLAGYTNSIIRSCMAEGAVSANTGTNGGMVGYLSDAGTLNGCISFNGSIVGGSAGIVNNCYFAVESESTNANAMLTEQLLTVEVLRDKLFWSEELWILQDGEKPALKRFAAVDNNETEES